MKSAIFFRKPYYTNKKTVSNKRKHIGSSHALSTDFYCGHHRLLQQRDMSQVLCVNLRDSREYIHREKNKKIASAFHFFSMPNLVAMPCFAARLASSSRKYFEESLYKKIPADFDVRVTFQISLGGGLTL